MADTSGTTTYTIDTLHRLTKVVTSANQTVQFGYDLKGQLTSITYPGGTNTVARAYDDAGRLSTVTDWNKHTTTYTYDVNSDLTGIAYPNSATAAFAYDNADRLTSITDAKAKSTFLSLTYAPDPIGQATTESSLVYGYNAINQLTSAGTTSYAYDGADNLRQTVITGPITATLSYDAANQLFSGSVMSGSTQVESLSFRYDKDGNRSQETGTGQLAINNTYGYDQANRLTSYGTTATYAYNGDGLRVSKTLSGTTTQQTWDIAEGLPLLLQDGTTSYVTGLGGLPLEQIAGNTTSYYHQDRIGSTRAITDSKGGVVSTYSYDAYGNVTGSTGTLSNPFQYAGQYSDSESGLQYDRARYYDPTVGGFLSRDPATAATRQPYGYASDSPVNGSDPGGLGLAEAGKALLGGSHDIAQNVPAALAYIGLAEIVSEHDKLVSGDPLKVTSAVLDILALASPLAIGLAGKVAIVGAESAAVGAESVAAESTDLAPAVIGRDMAGRVIPYAEENGYVYYKGAPEGMNAAERLAHNEAQINQWMAEGRQIIDIGPGNITTVSRAYNMEHSTIFGNNYANYVIHWIDEMSAGAMEAMG
jgi:RHS repeat-associated protein